MGFGTSIWLVVLGILAAANLIIARRPDAKEYIDKISPYQGWIGAISFIWGAFGIIFTGLLGIGLLATHPIWWISYLADDVLELVLGLVLGIGVLKTFIKAPAAQEKMDQALAKVAPYSGTLGLVAIGLGIWSLIATILF